MKTIFFITSLFCINFLFAAEHIVSSVDEANKWLNASKANDKIILKDGIYTNAVIKFTNNNISFVAEHAGKVFFEGNSTVSFAGTNNLIDGFVWRNGGKDLGTKSIIEFKNEKENANHCTMQNCAFIGYNNGDLNIDNKWISLYGEYNTFTQCLLQDKFNLGATLVVWLPEEKPAHHTISYNYFLNRQNGPNSDNGLESIRIGDSKTSMTNAHCTVAFNRFEQCDGEIEIISNKSCHNSYLHNTFYNSNGGLTLRHGNDCLVNGNFFNGEFKKRSYGVRFIGQGHVAINNYFFQLAGAASEPFRAPVTIVNGLINTPINGYFQVRRAVVANNIFVDCITPNIRIGAFSKREGMIVAPDTLTVKNNLFFSEDKKVEGNIYDEMSIAIHVSISNNKVCSPSLNNNVSGIEKMNYKNSKRNGFDWIKDGNGKYIASVEDRVENTDNKGVGADWVEPNILKATKKIKYTYLSAQQVGPIWMR